MRKKIIAGNWKMNKILSEGIRLSDELKFELKLIDSKALVILGVPFTHLEKINTNSENIYQVSAQDCSSKESGAYTAEVSASMIASTGAQYVILGHSERRAYHNENNSLLALKVNQCLQNQLQVIYCCGETLTEREESKHFDRIKNQISEALFHLTEYQIRSIVIAYEPVWAIGTGQTASSDQAQEMHAYIRSLFVEKYGQAIAQDLSILYGGSCNPSNASDLFSKEDVDGGLIGGASLNAIDFLEIIKSVE
jgi:triosephosphate isomerase